MRPFAALERLIERLIERPSARLFRARIQPLQLQRRLERAMETERRTAADRTTVPNRYTIRLNPTDMAGLAPVLESLVAELADSALVFARSHRYLVADRPQVALQANRAVATGDIVVEAWFESPDGSGAAAAPGTGTGTDGPVHGPSDTSAGAAGFEGTAVFSVPSPAAAVAVLRELRADGRGRIVPLDGRPITLGRARDNDVVLADGRVSRHHARLQGRRGTLVLSDLESRNGSRVNGVSVTEVVLGPGDRIQLGDSMFVIDGPPQD